ncbi:MFS transporter small subunit [Arthrobacter sp. AET 35A]
MKAASTIFVWALVALPLAYGVFQTMTRVSALFGA